MNQLALFEVAHHKDIIRDIIDFRDFDKKTRLEKVDGISYFVNEYWTAGQRQGHSIHEISYRACFKSQLPAFFINRLTDPGDAVYDPFMGRGTTPVEANLLGRRPIGNDINPLSVLLTRPRLRGIATRDIENALKRVPWESGRITREDLLVFYHPKTLARIEALKAWILEKAPLDEVDPAADVDWLRMIALNRLTGHSPGFFSTRTMPPNQAISVESQIRINEKLGYEPPERDIPKIILKKTRTLHRDGRAPKGLDPVLLTGAAWNTPQIADHSISLVVTSPPFLDVVQYRADNWLRCWFAGIDPDAVEISIHRTEEQWTEMVHNVLLEQARILEPGGHVAFEVGEVRNGKVLLERLVWSAAAGLPFDRLGVLVNDQAFTKTANCWGVSNGTKGTNTNRIVLLRRH